MKRLILIAAVVLAAAACSGRGPDGIRPGDLVLLSESAVATVYNAVPSQCNDDCLHTASMFAIDPERVEEYRIVAMERTMMAEFGICYGDRIIVSGAGCYDGEWRVEDTMNRRFAGQHRIDFLVPERHRHGKWTNVRVYKTADK